MQAFISDLDRTLIYRPGADELYLKEILRLGVDPQLARDKWYDSHGVPMLVQLVELGVSHSSAISFCDDLFQRVALMPAQTLPGATELLATAKELGFFVCVSTGSGQSLLEQTLQQTGLDLWVDLPLGSEHGMLKGINHMHKISQAAGLEGRDPFGDSWMIGDGINDMVIARDHGVGHRIGVAIPGVGGSSPDVLRQAGAHLVLDSLYHLQAPLRGI